jgi:hypothetical protein
VSGSVQLDAVREIAATGVRPHLDRQADEGREGDRLLDAVLERI